MHDGFSVVGTLWVLHIIWIRKAWGQILEHDSWFTKTTQLIDRFAFYCMVKLVIMDAHRFFAKKIGERELGRPSLGRPSGT